MFCILGSLELPEIPSTCYLSSNIIMDRMATETISLTDSIYIKRSPSKRLLLDGSGNKTPRELLIYFVPGNPGLVQYYDDFLTQLASTLDPDPMNMVYHIVGHSLGGFEIKSNTPAALQLEAMVTGQRPHGMPGQHMTYSLKQQEICVYESLQRTVELIRKQSALESGNGKDDKELQVMVVGHSVGAYILMQNLEMRRAAQVAGDESGPESAYGIIAGVALFPTIVDLAGSPRGRMVAVSYAIFSPIYEFWMQ